MLTTALALPFEQLGEHAELLGTATNNAAEYRALLLGLRRARELGASEVEVVGDSELGEIVSPPDVPSLSPGEETSEGRVLFSGDISAANQRTVTGILPIPDFQPDFLGRIFLRVVRVFHRPELRFDLPGAGLLDRR